MAKGKGKRDCYEENVSVNIVFGKEVDAGCIIFCACITQFSVVYLLLIRAASRRRKITANVSHPD